MRSGRQAEAEAHGERHAFGGGLVQEVATLEQRHNIAVC